MPGEQSKFKGVRSERVLIPGEFPFYFRSLLSYLRIKLIRLLAQFSTFLGRREQLSRRGSSSLWDTSHVTTHRRNSGMVASHAEGPQGPLGERKVSVGKPPLTFHLIAAIVSHSTLSILLASPTAPALHHPCLTGVYNTCAHPVSTCHLRGYHSRSNETGIDSKDMLLKQVSRSIGSFVLKSGNIPPNE